MSTHAGARLRLRLTQLSKQLDSGYGTRIDYEIGRFCFRNRRVHLREPPISAILTDVAYQRCFSPACGATYGISEVRVACDACGSLLDVAYDWNRLNPPSSFDFFAAKW